MCKSSFTSINAFKQFCYESFLFHQKDECKNQVFYIKNASQIEFLIRNKHLHKRRNVYAMSKAQDYCASLKWKKQINLDFIMQASVPSCR